MTYTPVSNYNGPDSFTFTVKDATVTSAPATVTITVAAVDDAPVSDSQSVTVTEDIATPITLTGSDADGTALTFTIGTGPTKGSLSGIAPNVTYTPNANSTAADSFTFRVTSGGVDSPAATVSITVTPANDPPTATDDTATVLEDSGANAINVLANDSFAPDTGETLTVTGGDQGHQRDGGDHRRRHGLTYTPAPTTSAPTASPTRSATATAARTRRRSP